MKARAHLFVSGRVQGVFFRESTRQQAVALSLAGWASNLPDGRVEVVAEGPRPALERLVEWCHQGPPASHVTAVAVSWEPFAGDLEGWATRR